MSRVKKTKRILEYTAIFEPAEEGGYLVRVPALPGCCTQGENFEDACRMAKDAIEGYLAVLQKSREEIPEEKASTVVTKIQTVLAR